MAKICFYCVATHLGGAERSLLEYLRFVKEHTSDEIEVLLPKSGGPLLEELKKLGIPYSVLPMPESLLSQSREPGAREVARRLITLFSPALPRYFFQLLRHLRKHRPHLIYTTGIKCHIIGAAASVWAGIPVLWHLRDFCAPGRVSALLRAFYRIVPRMEAVANSRATALSLSERRCPAVIYNGVSERDFPFARSAMLREELRIPEGTKIVGIIGVLARWKGQLEFLKMARDLLHRRSDIHFVIAGDQIYDTSGDRDYRKELEEAVISLGIQHHVTFLGFRKDTAAILQSLDVLVHASIRPEPFGRVIIEAMASGTLVTASAAGGPLEILRAGEDGLTHTPGNWLEMAKNVELLLNDESAAQIRESAYGRYLQYFTHDRYTVGLHVRVKDAAEKFAS